MIAPEALPRSAGGAPPGGNVSAMAEFEGSRPEEWSAAQEGPPTTWAPGATCLFEPEGGYRQRRMRRHCRRWFPRRFRYGRAQALSARLHLEARQPPPR